MSVPVCSHTAPDAHARSGAPLQYLHSLPKPRQCGCHVGNGYWKTSAEFGLASGGAGTAAAGKAPGPVGTTNASWNALKRSAAVLLPTPPVLPRIRSPGVRRAESRTSPTTRESGDV